MVTQSIHTLRARSTALSSNNPRTAPIHVGILYEFTARKHRAAATIFEPLESPHNTLPRPAVL